MKNTATVMLLCVLLLTLAGCAAGPNEMVKSPRGDDNRAGFWRGLCQGFIFPVTFFISLFTDSVNVYEVHNNSGCYGGGFLLGLVIILGGGGGGAAQSKQSSCS